MTGIGGDCFAMYAPGGRGTPLAFNGSGRAPAAATPEAIAAALAGERAGTSANAGADAGALVLERDSAHSVVVPGAVDAWTRAARRSRAAAVRRADGARDRGGTKRLPPSPRAWRSTSAGR